MISMIKSALLSALLICTATLGAMACTPRYEIQRGDTLWEIAGAQLDSVFDYVRIHERNRALIGPDPDLIYAGDVLDVPCGALALGDIDWSVMPNPDVLAYLMERAEIQVLDVRAEKHLSKGVIPVAIWIPYADWRGPKDNPGAPQTAEAYAEMIGAAGLRLDRPTVIVHNRAHPMSTGSAAHVYWMLRSLGAEQLAVLRGGFTAWAELGLPVVADPEAARPYDAPALAFSAAWRSTDSEIKQMVFGDEPGLLLDARPHKMYSKVDKLGEAIATTIPGARSLPAQPIMKALTGTFDVEDGVETVIDFYRDAGALGSSGDVVAFCHTGELAALNWFYASELAGIQNVKLYPESLKGWARDVGVFGPGLF